MIAPINCLVSLTSYTFYLRFSLLYLRFDPRNLLRKNDVCKGKQHTLCKNMNTKTN